MMQIFTNRYEHAELISYREKWNMADTCGTIVLHLMCNHHVAHFSECDLVRKEFSS